jgi:diguanylate cyclase (GGDEF)-like protein
VESMRESVLRCLDEFSLDDDKLISELNCIIEEGGNAAYQVIFSVLTHLDLTADKAEDYWKQIVSHRKSISKALGRNVNLRTAICDYFCSISKDMTNPIVIEIRVLEEALYSLKYDSLTGLYTRRTFDDMFLRETDRATRYELELAVLFFDLDDFKKINDTFGHLAGDETLKHVARIIMRELRTIDIAVRYGGEEIVVVLPETGKIDAFVVAERIRERVESTKLDYKGQNISLTISGGIASFPIDAADTENLIKNSDIAVYKAKETGKNNIVIFSEHKRRYIRVDFIADIKVQVVDPNNKIGTFETTSKNLSTGGILFESKYPIDIDTQVQLRIPTGTADEPLVVTGDVVRIEKFSSSQYDVGISFLGVSNAARSELSRCIRKCIRKCIEEKE